MSRRIVVTSNRNQQALVDFMMEKLGGKESVFREFYGQRIYEMGRDGASVEELFKEAREGGWQDELSAMRLKPLAVTILGKALHDRAFTAPSERSAESRRLSPEEVAEIHDRILVFLADHPWTSKPLIAKGVNADAKKLSARLRALRQIEKIQSHGEKASMRYALISERSKPKI